MQPLTAGYAGKERLAAVGTWNSKLLLLEVPSMKVVAEEKLSPSDLPRSTLFMALGQGYALLLGMGDGQLAHWQVRRAARHASLHSRHACSRAPRAAAHHQRPRPCVHRLGRSREQPPHRRSPRREPV